MNDVGSNPTIVTFVLFKHVDKHVMRLLAFSECTVFGMLELENLSSVYEWVSC